MVLSWRIHAGLSLPLLFVDLDKAGNSNTRERLDLLAIFDTTFGVDRIRFLMADREFVGEKWFQELDRRGIRFTIRIKKNMHLPWGEKMTQPAHYFFHHLLGYTTRYMIKNMLGITVYLAATRSAQGELVIVMCNTNIGAKRILAQYRERWSIEELFRTLKTSGFHWENTHMKEPKRLTILLMILGFAALVANLSGLLQKITWKKTLRCPLYSVFKRGLLHIQFIIRQSLQKAVTAILNLFQNIPNSLFPKSDG